MNFEKGSSNRKGSIKSSEISAQSFSPRKAAQMNKNAKVPNIEDFSCIMEDENENNPSSCKCNSNHTYSTNDLAKLY